MLYENMIILGGVLGNIMELYKVRLPLGEVFGQIFLLTGGVSVGIFTGCLAMSLAETLKALPTFSRRIRLSVGLPEIQQRSATFPCSRMRMKKVVSTWS